MRYARVAVEKTAYHFDRLFDYAVPEGVDETLVPGCRVLVPFGGGSHVRQGMVFALSDAAPSDVPPEVIKPIARQLDEQPALSAELLMLAQWLSETCFCTLYDAARAMLPAGLSMTVTRAYKAGDGMSLEKLDGIEELTKAERTAAAFVISNREAVARDRLIDAMGLAVNSDIPERLAQRGIISRVDETARVTGDKTVRMVRIADGVSDENAALTSPRQREVFELLCQVGSANVSDLRGLTGVSQQVIAGMVKKGTLEYFSAEVYRRPKENDGGCKQDAKPIVLTDEQQRAYEHLLERCRSGETSTSLLYGVTGSGKTSVFLRLIDDMLAEGRGVIVMLSLIHI